MTAARSLTAFYPPHTAGFSTGCAKQFSGQNDPPNMLENPIKRLKLSGRLENPLPGTVSFQDAAVSKVMAMRINDAL
jgi:hypothetical protein